MSDLQCPAIVVLIAPGQRVPAGIAQALEAEAPDGAALRRSLDELSDLHRGETVAVMAPAEQIVAILGREPPVAVAIDSSGWTVLSHTPA